MHSRFLDLSTNQRVPEEQVEDELRGLLGDRAGGSCHSLVFDFLVTLGYGSTRTGEFNLATFHFWCEQYNINGFRRYIYHDFLDGRYKFDPYRF